MIRVETLYLTNVRLRTRPTYFSGGNGPTVFENVSTAPPPLVTNGILKEAGADFVMMEDGTSYILQEA